MTSRSRRDHSPRSIHRAPPAVAETAATTDSLPNTTNPFPGKFDELLELMKTQNGLISQQSETLKEQKDELAAQHLTIKKHTGMLEALEKDATKGS